MGARATITIYQEGQDTPLNLYTHWEGGNICQTLAEGLQKAIQAGRLDDSPYCTRIIFDTLTGLEGGSTGFGIIVGDHDDINYDSPVLVFGKGEPVVHYGSLTIEARKWADMFAPTKAEVVTVVV